MANFPLKASTAGFIMNDTIIKALTSLVEFNEEELFHFLKLLKPRTLNKNDFILEAGDICKSMVIINRGGLRYFTINDKGEQSYWFAFEGEWLGDYESFLTRQPSSHFIQAIEATEVFALSYDDMQQLYASGVKFERFGRLIAENLFIKVERSRNELTSLPAEQRYLNLMKDHPNILKRVPVQHIATYLGIQPQSLSRIRRNIAIQKS
jgi:CRP-like cAMP-binding protein